MKKFLRIATSLLLTLTIVLTGVPCLDEVFAGSSSGPDRSDKYSDWNSGDYTGANGRRPENDATKKTYILEMIMGYGSEPDVCKYIMIKYYADATSKANNRVSTQYLKVDSKSIYGENYATANDWITGKYAFLGSRELSYAPFIDNTQYNEQYLANAYPSSDATVTTTVESYGGSAFKLNGKNVVKRYDKYKEWAGKIISDEASDFYPDVKNKFTQDAFQSGVTEAIRLRFEYGFYELVEMQFYCEADTVGGVFDFPVAQWTLYEQVDSSGKGETRNVNGTYAYNLGTTRIENYAFVSRSAGLSFNGKALYQSVSADDAVHETYGKDGLSMSYVGGVTFVWRNAKYITEGERIADTIYQFKEVNYSVSTSDRSIFNFCINIADEYGAGIDSYIADGKTGKTTFKECLYATIQYKDTNGYKQAIELPVMTNALLEFAIPIDDDPEEKNSIVYSSPASEAGRYANLIGDSYVGFAQEGDSIWFSVDIPKFSEFIDISLIYAAISPNDNFKIKDILVYNNLGYNDFPHREAYRNLSKSNCAIDMTLAGEGLEVVYRNQGSDPVEFNVGTEEYTFKLAKATNAGDVVDYYGGTSKGDKYLITIDTAAIKGADCGTTAEVQFSLRYYDVSGKELDTGEYDLMTLVTEYYGYNPCTKTKYTPDQNADGTLKKDDAGNQIYKSESVFEELGAQYYHCMDDGNTIKFFMDISNVMEFTGMTMSFKDPTATDEWKPNTIKIDKLTEGVSVIGKRIYGKADENFELGTQNGIRTVLESIRYYDREVSGTRNVLGDGSGGGYKIGATLTRGNKIAVDFISNRKTAEEKKKDYSEYKYNMSEDVAAKDLGLGTPSVKFNVAVHVKDNATSALLHDACGSNNLFYFQLLFDSAGGGTHTSSGYVLANDQLTADGFRSGQIETFSIMVNENVGDVTGINIIPDYATADADTFDKLNIDYIEVIRNNENSIDKRFVVEDVGWIAPKYSDNGEESEKTGRSASDMVISKSVSYSAYVVELEFAFAMGDYGMTDGVQNPPFIGNLQMDLTYMTSGDSPRTITKYGIQVVDAIAQYCSKDATVDDDLNGFCSDSSYMFVNSGINRFIIQLSDCSLLKSFRLTGMVKNTSFQNIFPLKSVQVRCLMSDGVPDIGEDGFWYKNYNIEPVIIAPSAAGLPKQLYFSASATGNWLSTGAFQFEDVVELPALTDEYKITSLVGREPKSANDKLNLYIYMKDGVQTQAEGGYNLDCRIFYSILGGDVRYYAEAKSMAEKKDVNENGKTVAVIYETGIAATNMATITNVVISDPNILGNTKIEVDYAIIQRVRDNTVIDTYTIRFGGSMVGLLAGGISMLGKFSAEDVGYKQIVTIQLGEGEEEGQTTAYQTIVPEKFDIALAIRYKSTSTGGDIYQSKYVFASDGNDTKIGPGSVLTFEFNEAYVKSIEELEIVGMNGIEAYVVAASTRMYRIDSDDVANLTQQYSMTEGIKVTAEKTKYDIGFAGVNNSTTLVRSDLTFHTSDKINVVDSNGSAPIRMNLCYLDVNDKEQFKEIPDIRKYVSSGDGYAAGQSVTVSLFLKGAEKLRYIELDPHIDDESELGSWNLDRVDFSLEKMPDQSLQAKAQVSQGTATGNVSEEFVQQEAAAQDEVLSTSSSGASTNDIRMRLSEVMTGSMNVNRTIYENDKLENRMINLSTITVTCRVTNDSEKPELLGTITNDTLKIQVDVGHYITVKTTIGDSTAGYNIRQCRLLGEALVPVKNFGTNNDTIKFTAVNDTNNDVTWVLEISSAESPGVKSYIYVIVPPGDEEDEEDTDPFATKKSE